MDLLKISDHMNRHPVTFTEEMSVEEAVNKLILAEQLGGPVINKAKKVIGFVSEQDCLARMLSGTYHLQQAASVKDVMRTEVLTVKSYHGIVDLAQTMLMSKPKVYPVVEHGKVIGTINRTNVLKAMNIYMQQCYLSPV